MEVLLETKKKLSELIKEVYIYPQILENVKVHDKKNAREDEKVIDIIKKVTEELGNDGRILVRESGTEPVIRVMVEAKSHDLCSKYVSTVIQVLKQQGHIKE